MFKIKKYNGMSVGDVFLPIIKAIPTIPPSINELGYKKSSIESAARNAPNVIHTYVLNKWKKLFDCSLDLDIQIDPVLRFHNT